jgi:proteasome lid subunit RPN8/RPN11
MSPSPVVIIEDKAFLMMLLAVVEPFRKESMGFLFGRKPTKSHNRFLITSVMPVQLAALRSHRNIIHNESARKRIYDVIERNRKSYSLIGDFHSHPQSAGFNPAAWPSCTDVSDMASDFKNAYIVIAISSKKKKMAWDYYESGELRGSMGNYTFKLNAFRVLEYDKEKEETSIEKLKIVSPKAIRKLNAAL